MKCTVTAIKVGGAFVTESSYASALIAAVKSTSGESVLGVVSYSGLPGAILTLTLNRFHLII